VRDEAAIRDAASLILVRDGARVLMGFRGAGAVFLPSVRVFPGGAVDPGDHRAEVTLSDDCRRRLGPMADVLAACALRETVEETGLTLRPGARLTHVCRAITPPGETRRYDARFFTADAADVAGDPDDLSRASGELSGLAWVPLLPPPSGMHEITAIILAETVGLLLSRTAAGLRFLDHRSGVLEDQRVD
jgi:8-oxo-dGTP pyrophosphatase MutT (NUDIX family)